MIVLVLSIFWGCGAQDECAGTRDLLNSPAGLALTEQEHPAGWARTECFQCHQAFEIHASDCLKGVSVDGAAINDQIDVNDTTTCVQCHGANGNAAWEALLDTGDTAP